MIKYKIVRDFDGYFERYTKELMTKVDNPRIKAVEIDSGPYRPYSVNCGFNKETGTLKFDYYSAIRAGFGTITSQDRESLINDINNL